MFKIKKLVVFFPVSLFAVAALSGCSKDNHATRVLRIYNSEDYIYEYDPEYDDEYADLENEDSYAYKMNMTEQFEKYWEKEHGEKIEVIYETFDTNETMFNELQTGKSHYDVVITSDYMVQKLASKDMLYKFPEEEMDFYWENISPYMNTKLEPIDIFKNDGTNVGNLTQFCVPYMWGTIGIMYNPAKYIEEAPEFYINRLGDTYDPEVDLYDQALDLVIEDFSSWDVLYRTDEGNPYSNSFSIKDSVRDTYAVSTVHAHADEIANITDNAELTELFNKCDAETIALVKEDMLKLKENAFGFETDSGKTDMTTKKIGANMCWSGDATWAITVAENPSLENENAKPEDSLILYYSIPTGKNYEEATNLWYDCLAMPNNGHSAEAEAQYELAERFIEFMCDPENAAQNCDCVGYTPAVAGDAMLDYMYWSYDVRGEVIADQSIDEYAEENGLVEGVDYEVYDISYFFEGSLDEYAEIEDVAKLMAYPEYVGRQLTAQYPTKEDLPRLAIMRDFGPEGNQRLLDMWESVRTNSLPVWAIVLLCFEVAIGLGLGAYFIAKKVSRKKLKKARNTK